MSEICTIGNHRGGPPAARATLLARADGASSACSVINFRSHIGESLLPSARGVRSPRVLEKLDRTFAKARLRDHCSVLHQGLNFYFKTASKRPGDRAFKHSSDRQVLLTLAREGAEVRGKRN